VPCLVRTDEVPTMVHVVIMIDLSLIKNLQQMKGSFIKVGIKIVVLGWEG